MLVPLGMLAGAAMGEWVTSRRSGEHLLALEPPPVLTFALSSPPQWHRLLESAQAHHQ